MPALLAGGFLVHGNLSVRNRDDALVLGLQRRATRRGRSAEAAVREILRHSLSQETEPGFAMMWPPGCGH
jgi:plasmid stability protein